MPVTQDAPAAAVAVAGPQPAPPPPDPLAFFRLRPIRAARVSEVSETTAAAPVPCVRSPAQSLMAMSALIFSSRLPGDQPRF